MENSETSSGMEREGNGEVEWLIGIGKQRVQRTEYPGPGGNLMFIFKGSRILYSNW